MLTYRKLLEAFDEAQKRKAQAERLAEELFRCAKDDRVAQDEAWRKSYRAEARLDEEITEE